MSLFDHRLVLLLALALAACGFTPVYAPGGSGDALRNTVEVRAPQDVDEYILVETLETRLGRAATPLYFLSFDLATSVQGQAVTASNETTRYSIVGRVDYVLRSAGDDAILASGNVNNFSGYSATGSTVETLAAERDARSRLMTILAEQITTQIYSTLDVPG
jgi:LPS-assembly lipoprotein